MTLPDVSDVYFDAGVCTTGKSWAGSIAFVLLDAAGAVLYEHAAPVIAAAHGQETVENNALETMALAAALRLAPDGWAGCVHGDNLNAIRRAFDPEGTTFAGVPAATVRLCHANRARLGRFTTRLLGGHPSRADLARGTRAKDGKPVSVWNKRCDDLATAIRRGLQEARRGT